ncbi:hypothetical protein [Actibacterium lipolyticum]|uniref:Uncharacterized protein n=1 Tax=Actibacterium lipolyticum TaxID=1524263 RepID=A0A238KNG5_9RHOB|nr:hypothetical protein [Actibacterium lipolyticum]SMX44177.1 hypothetical protein COL8621_02491 [Actibacterium lipolyticum]
MVRAQDIGNERRNERTQHRPDTVELAAMLSEAGLGHGFDFEWFMNHFDMRGRVEQ